ncbi:MAG: hypothetical protein II393_03695, partial [Cytophagales bacterium]|nr:hypothetical protein [Cytophagales bacterium]
VLLAAAESTYDAWGCKKFKDCCCGKLCNKDDKNSPIINLENNNNNNNLSPEIPGQHSGI